MQRSTQRRIKLLDLSVARSLVKEMLVPDVTLSVDVKCETCRYCCCGVSLTRVICGLSVFGESLANSNFKSH